jgi:putative ABC transport system permease protein
MSTLIQDFRYALRTLAKSPGFTAAAVVTLTLGIGANTAIFSVVRAALLKPLPYPEPHRLVGIWEKQPEVAWAPGAAGDIADWQSQNRTFDAIAYADYSSYALTGEGEPSRVLGAKVSPGFFGLLGVSPERGRLLGGSQATPEKYEVVLSHGFWQKHFPGGSDAVGRSLRLDGESYFIVGVMPRSFDFPERASLWTPLVLTPKEQANRGTHSYQVLGRLKPGVTLAQAEADLHLIEARLQKAFPVTNAGHDTHLLPLDRQMTGQNRATLWMLFGAVAFVLLIACANVANLLLARTLARRREMAVRVALGAGRARIVRQLLTESTLLAGCGGGLGLAAAVWGLDLTLKVLPVSLSPSRPVTIDAAVLAFTLAASVATGILFGLGPALAVARPDVTAMMGSGNRLGSEGPDRGRLRSLLVVAEIALALVLLVGAGLMLRTVAALQRVDPGFRAEEAATFELSLPAARYAQADSKRVFYREALRRLAALTGVSAAGATNSLPIGGSNTNGDFKIGGRPPWPPDKSPITYYRVVTPDYFSAAHIPLRRGRAFADADRETAAPVALINETMARRFFAGQDPIGERVQIEWGEDKAWREIVGIVADVRGDRLEDEAVPETYMPFFQHPLPTMAIVVRTTGDPGKLLAPIRREIRALDGDLPVSQLAPFVRVLDEAVAPRRQSTLLLSLFGALAAVLAALGLSSVLAYSVAQRTREIGIRLALGAQRRDILRLVIRQAMTLSQIGIGAGLIGALGLTRLIAGQLYGVRATDPATLAGGVVLIAAVAFAASALPAGRASRVQPMEALRSE